MEYSGIDDLVRLHERIEQDFSPTRGTIQGNWEKEILKSACSNKKCNKRFSWRLRSRHCRRCGDLFCKDCVSFERRLDDLANPDPDGKLMKVCETCYDQKPQELGVTRNLWEQFVSLKQRQRRLTEAPHTAKNWIRWRQRFDLRRETNRLVDGFLRYVKDTGGVGRALRDLSHIVTIPEWQKAHCWALESLVSKCRFCQRDFGVWLHRRHCRVCGAAVCANCSNCDLIVYVCTDDPASGDARAPVAKLAIIKVVGCPEVEPSVCTYLRVCTECTQRLIDVQVTSHTRCNSSHPLLDKIADQHEHLMDAREKILSHLNDYQTIIESLDDNTVTSRTESETGASRSNMKVLAKAQTDLSDFFTQYIMSITHLKQLKPLASSPLQSKLLANFIKSTCDFYLDNMSAFRMHKHSLEVICRPEMLQLIQRIINKDAIVSAHVYLRQIAYEAIHLTDKHAILSGLPSVLIAIEAEVEKEAKECIVGEGEDWAEHQQLMQQLVQSQVQDHRLIRPSRRLSQQLGTSHVESVTLTRTLDVLMQVRLQLSLKTAQKSFKLSKTALLDASAEIEKYAKTQ